MEGYRSVQYHSRFSRPNKFTGPSDHLIHEVNLPSDPVSGFKLNFRLAPGLPLYFRIQLVFGLNSKFTALICAALHIIVYVANVVLNKHYAVIHKRKSFW